MSDRTFTQLELISDLIAIGTDTGRVKFWDLFQETFLYELRVAEGEVSELLLHPSEDWLAVVVDQSRLFRIDLEARSFAELHLQDYEDKAIRGIAFSQDGSLLAVAGAETIGIWDTTDWINVDMANFPGDVSASLHFVKGNSDLVLIVDRLVSRWSFTDRKLNFVQALNSRNDGPQCILLGGDISPDGSLLVTTDKCGILRAWSLEINREWTKVGSWRHLAEEHFGVPTRFSPDGRLLVERVDDWGFTLLFFPEGE